MVIERVAIADCQGTRYYQDGSHTYPTYMMYDDLGMQQRKRATTAEDGSMDVLTSGVGGLAAGAMLAGTHSPGEALGMGAGMLAGGALGAQNGTGGLVAGSLVGGLVADNLAQNDCTIQ